MNAHLRRDECRRSKARAAPVYRAHRCRAARRSYCISMRRLRRRFDRRRRKRGQFPGGPRAAVVISPISFRVHEPVSGGTRLRLCDAFVDAHLSAVRAQEVDAVRTPAKRRRAISRRPGADARDQFLTDLKGQILAVALLDPMPGNGFVSQFCPQSSVQSIAEAWQQISARAAGSRIPMRPRALQPARRSRSALVVPARSVDARPRPKPMPSVSATPAFRWKRMSAGACLMAAVAVRRRNLAIA